MYVLQIMPLSIHNVMNAEIHPGILKVNRVFRKLCTKVVYRNQKEELFNDVVIALCMLEKEFPQGFFNVTTHLMVHLVE
jgi:hypothetical protein